LAIPYELYGIPTIPIPMQASAFKHMHCLSTMHTFHLTTITDHNRRMEGMWVWAVLIADANRSTVFVPSSATVRPLMLITCRELGSGHICSNSS